MKALPAIILSTGLLHAADWPQYLGPDRTSVSGETGLVRSFRSDGPAFLWETEVEKGFGRCAVVGDEVFLVDRVEKEMDILLCLDFATGVEKWRFESPSEGEPNFPGSRNVPTVEEDAVYFIGTFGEVFCIDRTMLLRYATLESQQFQRDRGEAAEDASADARSRRPGGFGPGRRRERLVVEPHHGAFLS